MGIGRLRVERSVILSIAFATAALLIFGIKSQPSLARPLNPSSIDSYRAAWLRESLLLAQVVQRSLNPDRTAPQSSVTFTNPRLLVSTPKVDDVGLSSNVEKLKIQTVFRAQRIVHFATPSLRFSVALRPGTHKLARAGVPSITMLTERVTMWNDVIVDRQVVNRVTVQHSRPAIVVSAPPRNVAEAMAMTGSHKLVAVYRMIATAYTADSAQAYPTGRTASGLPAQYGVVAVDPRIIPLGTQLYIEGYGTAIAADTGGAIIGNRIDLCMDSLARAIDWGRQPVRVFVLRNR